MAKRGPRQPDRTARFWERVDIGGAQDCWPWVRGAIAVRGGYGVFYDAGRNRRANRVAYELHHGVTLDRATVIRHTCNNPPCVNPSHLITGTQQENLDDMRGALRHPRGEDFRSSKLTDETVRWARARLAEGWYQREVAAALDVSVGTIGSMVLGKTWTHVV